MMETEYDHDRIAVWRGAQPGIRTGILGCVLGELAVSAQHVGGHGARPHQQASKNSRTHLVELVVERRHHAEVAAPAAHRPEEVRVLVGASGSQLTVRGHDVDGEHVVAAQAVCSAKPANSTAKREPGNPSGGDNPACGRQAEGLRLSVKLAPGQSSLSPNDSTPLDRLGPLSSAKDRA
jgi:hypothetical protein